MADKKKLVFTKNKKFEQLAYRVRDINIVKNRKQFNSLDQFYSPTYSKYDIGYVSDEPLLNIIVTHNYCFDFFYKDFKNDNKEFNFDVAIENIKNIVNKFNIKRAIISGGEPLLYDKIDLLIEKLNNYCNINDIWFELNYKTVYAQNRFINILDRYNGINRLFITFDNEDAINVEVLGALFKTVQRFNYDVKVSMVTHIYKENYDNIIDLLKFIDKLTLRRTYCDELIILPIYNNDKSLDISEIKALFQRITAYYDHWYAILQNDNVYGCMNDILIPTPVPIILRQIDNEIINTQKLNNDINSRYINIFNCLIDGSISLSLNEEDILKNF